MKKITTVLLFLLISSGIYCAESISFVDLKNTKAINSGMFIQGPVKYFSGFSRNYIIDTYTGQLVITDKNFKKKSSVSLDDFPVTGDSQFLHSGTTIAGLNRDEKTLFFISTEKNKASAKLALPDAVNIRLLFFAGNFLLAADDSSAKYCSFVVEGTKISRLSNHRTLNYIETNYTGDLSFSVLGSKVFYNDAYIAPNSELFRVHHGISGEKFFHGIKLIGYDIRGNSYWGNLSNDGSDSILVYSKDGKFLTEVSGELKDVRSRFSLTAAGEIFYFSYDSPVESSGYYTEYNSVSLKRLEFPGLKTASMISAQTNEFSVRLRTEPNTSCKTICLLEKHLPLKIISRSKTRQQIGSMNSYWYKVLLADGTIGWVYGYFVDVLR